MNHDELDKRRAAVIADVEGSSLMDRPIDFMVAIAIREADEVAGIDVYNKDEYILLPKWQPMDLVPTDGRLVLVYLPDEPPHNRIHSATFRPDGKPSIIGHHFAFDLSKPSKWMDISSLINDE